MRIPNPFLKTEYILQGPLGSGLTSRVYKAIRKHRKLGLEQTVALKVLNSRNEVLALKNEIRVLTQIRSPHCVQLLGWEDLSIGSTLVLEYLDGVSLLDLAVSTALSSDVVEEIIAQVQEGLSHLEHHQICHGDLSPRNIFITKQGVVKLLDFGFSGKNSGREFFGTPQFIAPEIWLGHSSSPASDLFALGLLREDLLTGNLVTDKSNTHWQQRTLDILGKNSLLSSDPKDREFLKIESQKNRREDLALATERAYEIKNSVKSTERVQLGRETAVVSAAPRKMWLRLLSATFVFLFFNQLQTANQPLQPLPPKVADEKPVKFKIDVRSHKWASVVLVKKGERAGKTKLYVPHTFKHLEIGEYELHYRSPKGTGMIPVALNKNKRILLE